jgi:hypothetical protein
MESHNRDQDHSTVRIRVRERAVNIHDLKKIIIQHLDSGCRVRISVHDGTLFSGFLGTLEPKQEIVVISNRINGTDKRAINMSAISSVEFDTGCVYQGLTSKVFRIIE